jgi:murein DD-endopeptidase MepM/ murein hydrolase activator NlpD
MVRYILYINILCLIVLVSLGITGTKMLYAVADNGRIDEKKERQKEIHDEKAEIKKELAPLLSQKKEIIRDLLDTDRDLSFTQERLLKKEKDLSRKRAQREVISDQLELAADDLDNTQELFEQRLRIYYESGMHNPLNVFIDAKNLSDLVRRIKYTEGLLSFDKKTIETIVEQKVLLSDIKLQLDGEVKDEEELCRDIQSEKSRYQELYTKKKVLKQEISKDINQREKLLEELDREDNEIEWFLEAAARGNIVTNFDGSFSCPLDKYGLSSGFGVRYHPIFRRKRMHNGIDLTAPKGTPIHSAGAGVIIYAGWKKGYGNTVMIDHGRGYATLYGHMSSIYARVGDKVAEGQTIGTVGSTGISTGNHVHFEIRVNGKPDNPSRHIRF